MNPGMIIKSFPVRFDFFNDSKHQKDDWGLPHHIDGICLDLI